MQPWWILLDNCEIVSEVFDASNGSEITVQGKQDLQLLQISRVKSPEMVTENMPGFRKSHSQILDIE